MHINDKNLKLLNRCRTEIAFKIKNQSLQLPVSNISHLKHCDCMKICLMVHQKYPSKTIL